MMLEKVYSRIAPKPLFDVNTGLRKKNNMLFKQPGNFSTYHRQQKKLF